MVARSYSSMAEILRHRCSAKWKLLLDYENNKFIAEMTDDSLPIDKFIFYLKQDHIFLKEFCSFLANARAAEEPSLKRWLGELHYNTINYEMQMQKKVLDSLELSGGINIFSSSSSAAKATLNYISFLKKVSVSRSVEEMVSAMAPCPWSYLEIAQKILMISCSNGQNKIRTEAYQKWIEFYSSKESQQQVEYLKSLLGTLYENASKSKKLVMEYHFSIACQYEHDFWKMAYNVA
jgi:thiaminase/transcriptional activator TenA